MRLTPTRVWMLLGLVGMSALFCVITWRRWYVDRGVILVLCDGTRVHHSKETWSKIASESELFYRRPEALRDFILQIDFIELDRLIREQAPGPSPRDGGIRGLGATPQEDELDQTKQSADAGPVERMPLRSQLIWLEISLLRQWQPGTSVKQVLDRTRSFDRQGLEAYVSSTRANHH